MLPLTSKNAMQRKATQCNATQRRRTGKNTDQKLRLADSVVPAAGAGCCAVLPVASTADGARP